MYYFPTAFFSDLQTFLSLPSSHNSHTLTSHDFDPKDPLYRLKMVKFDRKEDFCIFLSLLILTDQILYTYDKDNYSEFEAKYNLPKLEFCGHGKVTNNPFSILSYVKVDEITFLFQTRFFFKHFIVPSLNPRQQQVFLQAVQEDEDLEKYAYGRVVKFVGRKGKY